MITIETIDFAGTEIYVLKDFLSGKQCDNLKNCIEGIAKPQGIYNLPYLKENLWSVIKEKIQTPLFFDKKKCRPFKIVGLSDDITITNASFPTGKHRDKDIGSDKFKLYFYLNCPSKECGTTFYDGDKKISIENEIGKGVLFDIDLEHEGNKIPKGHKKVVIGARPKIVYIN